VFQVDKQTCWLFGCYCSFSVLLVYKTRLMQIAVVTFFCVRLSLSCCLSGYNNFNIGLADFRSNFSHKLGFRDIIQLSRILAVNFG